jgi:hypothetical protein
MATKKVINSTNGHIPTAKDFTLPTRLTKNDKELLKAGREAMDALAAEKKKYGNRLLSGI